MKYLSPFIAALVLSFAPAIVHAQDGPPPPPPPESGDTNQDDQGASFQEFYDQLGDQGQWVQTQDYGYVFQPTVTDPQWAPYREGHWVYTDEGWMWVSDEPWGWATYHYGRWANIDGTGWVWVPGYRWAPAWVSWRYGGGYAGWAPLPPETFIGAEYAEPGVSVGIGFHFGGDVDVNFNIGPGCYNFVPVGYLGERNYRGRYLDRGRNYTVINNTTNVTNININKTTIINNNGNNNRNNFRGVAVGGPPINEVNAHSNQHVQTVQLAESRQRGDAKLNGNTMSVYAPRVNAASAQQARPGRVDRTIDNPKFNRGDSISQPLQVTSNLKGTAASQEEIQAARKAAASAPAKAKIAREGDTPRTQITKPLNSLQPVANTHRGPQANTQEATGNAGKNTQTPRAENSTAAPFTGGQNANNAERKTKEKPVTQPSAQPQAQVQKQQPVNPKTSKKNADAEDAFTGGGNKRSTTTTQSPVNRSTDNDNTPSSRERKTGPSQSQSQFNRNNQSQEAPANRQTLTPVQRAQAENEAKRAANNRQQSQGNGGGNAQQQQRQQQQPRQQQQQAPAQRQAPAAPAANRAAPAGQGPAAARGNDKGDKADKGTPDAGPQGR